MQPDTRPSQTPLIGYLAVHTFGLLMGTLLLPPSPSTFRRMQRQRKGARESPSLRGGERAADETIERQQPDKAAIELFSYAMAWWTLLGIIGLSLPFAKTASRVQHPSIISRRLVRISAFL